MSMLRVRPVMAVRLVRCLSETAGKPPGSTPPPKQPPTPAAKPPTAAAKQATPSKPTTDPTKYNVPEYYEHNTFSYYDIDVSMHKHRLPQPSKFDPLVPKT